MSEARRKIVLKKLSAHNTIWHPESTLVFKSQKERLVIGRMDDAELIHLDEKCVELAEAWSFNIDESMLQGESEESEEAIETEQGKQDESEDEPDPDGTGEPSSLVRATTFSPQPTTSAVSGSSTCIAKDVAEIIDGLQGLLAASVSKTSDTVLAYATDLSDKLMERESELVDARKENDALQAQLVESQGKYDAINSKFDAMKSLFN